MKNGVRIAWILGDVEFRAFEKFPDHSFGHTLLDAVPCCVVLERRNRDRLQIGGKVRMVPRDVVATAGEERAEQDEDCAESGANLGAETRPNGPTP